MGGACARAHVARINIMIEEQKGIYNIKDYQQGEYLFHDNLLHSMNYKTLVDNMAMPLQLLSVLHLSMGDRRCYKMY